MNNGFGRQYASFKYAIKKKIYEKVIQSSSCMAEICSSVECVISYVTFRMDSLCGVMCLEDSSKIIKCTHRFDGIFCMRLLSVSLRQSTMSQKPVKLSNQRHQKHMFNNGVWRTPNDSIARHRHNVWIANQQRETANKRQLREQLFPSRCILSFFILFYSYLNAEGTIFVVVGIEVQSDPRYAPNHQ